LEFHRFERERERNRPDLGGDDVNLIGTSDLDDDSNGKDSRNIG